MKIAILGGTFNPIHTGHLILASAVCEECGYDKVIFVPALNPPHKEIKASGGRDPSGAERLKMCRLAVKGDSRFLVNDCELKRKGVSYTYDTICFLEEKYKNQLEGKIGLIMGDDLLSGFHLWHRAEELSKRCRLLLAVRKKSKEEKSFENHASGEYAKLDQNALYDWQKDPLFKDAVRLENPLVTLSSTQIRAMAAKGQNVNYLVPKKVFKYIQKKELYL